MTPEWEALIVGINRYPEYTNFNDLTVAGLDGKNVAQRLDQYGYQPFRIQDLPLGLTQKGAGGVPNRGIVKLEELRSVQHRPKKPRKFDLHRLMRRYLRDGGIRKRQGNEADHPN